MAGLFYAWSCAVMPGLARLPDKEFVAAMRSFNRAIQNPLFFAAFFGAPVSLIASTILHYGSSARFYLLLAAALLYLIGTFGVTLFGNVPLNDALERFDPETAAAAEIERRRASFETPWNRLNTIRTVSATLAVVLSVAACLN